jgi:hypothetical protein
VRGTKHKSSLLCSLLHSPVTSSFLGASIVENPQTTLREWPSFTLVSEAWNKKRKCKYVTEKPGGWSVSFLKSLGCVWAASRWQTRGCQGCVQYLVYCYTTFAVSSPSRTKHGAVRTGLRTKTARSRDLLEKLTVTHLVSFPAFCATQRCIIVPWSIHTASQDSFQYYSPLFAEVKLRTGGSWFEFWRF